MLGNNTQWAYQAPSNNIQDSPKEYLVRKKGEVLAYANENSILGHQVDRGMIWMDKSKVQVMVEWQIPKKVLELISFLGFVNCYRHFISRISKRTASLMGLLKLEEALLAIVRQMWSDIPRPKGCCFGGTCTQIASLWETFWSLHGYFRRSFYESSWFIEKTKELVWFSWRLWIQSLKTLPCHLLVDTLCPWPC